jgi:catechol 2,3-dioxygenase-like lactoylglutathione lyase family enzyme
MTLGIDLDHTAFAVHDAMDWARRLRRELGAKPTFGEEFEVFRYLQLRIGSDEDGATLELLEPAADGFLTRFLAKHGEGPHHLTFTVPDLRAAVADARSAGLTVVGESYDDPSWREAFIVPDDTHAVVVQLAETDGAYPPEPQWWAQLLETPAGPSARLGMTHLGSTDLEVSQRIFGGLLQANAREQDSVIDFVWPSGTVRVHLASRPGVMGMSLHRSSVGNVEIGAAWLGKHD